MVTVPGWLGVRDVFLLTLPVEGQSIVAACPVKKVIEVLAVATLPRPFACVVTLLTRATLIFKVKRELSESAPFLDIATLIAILLNSGKDLVRCIMQTFVVRSQSHLPQGGVGIFVILILCMTQSYLPVAFYLET